MISILIPTYNYNLKELLIVLNQLLKEVETPYKIICYEDGSESFIDENRDIIKKVPHAKHIISKENKGRITSRQILAKLATYDWILFIDADMIPRKNTYILNYLNYIKSDFDAVYGGYYYAPDTFENKFSLRWLYGKKYEEVVAKKRNRMPYKVILSGNFLIKRKIFIDINSLIDNDGYGYDNYLGAIMKLKKTKVFHIDNNTIHEGLETNSHFLKKVEEAVENLNKIHDDYPYLITENTLLETYRKTKRYKLTYVIKWFFVSFRLAIIKNLKSDKPNLILLQLYKLGYFCFLKPNNS